MNKKIEKLEKVIKHDLEMAEIRFSLCKPNTLEYKFNQAVRITLKTILFDMRELKLIK